MDTKFAAAIASLSLGIIGIALGMMFCTFIQSVARNPSVQPKLFGPVMLFFALVESLALFCLLVVFLILYST